MFYTINKNAQPNGDHEIHKTGCTHEPLPHNRISLGFQPNDSAALIAGKKIFPSADGCKYCCPTIHHH